jgi:hypothetical protein
MPSLNMEGKCDWERPPPGAVTAPSRRQPAGDRTNMNVTGERVMETAERDRSGHPGVLVAAAALSLSAGIVHALVVPEYLSEWWGYGFFFTLAALCQITYGLVLFMRPWAYDETGGSRSESGGYAGPVYLAGACANLAIIGLYSITRTVGIPFFGPAAGKIEPVTALSLTVTVIEAVLAGILIVMSRRETPAFVRQTTE